jgi:hypothetical protein
MRETKSGRAPLRALRPPAEAYEVDFEIHFDTELRTIRSGMPPVPKISATVTLMQSTDGRSIPAGHYELAAGGEFLRLQNLGFSWQVIASP